jgi:hypothetical protein
MAKICKIHWTQTLKYNPQVISSEYEYSNIQASSSSTEKIYSQEGLEHCSRDIQRDQSAKAEFDNNTHSTSMSPSMTAGLQPKILYHRICKDAEGTIVENIESPKPIPASDTGASKNLTDQTVLEVLTTKVLRTFAPVGEKNVTTKIKIYSLHLINVLRDIVQYWPGLNLVEHPVVIAEPYAVLIHHLDALEACKSNHPTCHSREYMKLCNDHIDTLLGFLDKTSGDEIRLERQRHQKSPPMATFANLWMLFKPGQDVYIKEREAKAAIPMRVGSTLETFSIPESSRSGRMHRKAQSSLLNGYNRVFRVQGWGIGCTGTEMSTQIRGSDIEQFEGEKEIRSLSAYPKEFHDNPNYEQELQRRGRRYWELCEPAYRHYDGATVADLGQQRMQVRIFISTV